MRRRSAAWPCPSRGVGLALLVVAGLVLGACSGSPTDTSSVSTPPAPSADGAGGTSGAGAASTSGAPPSSAALAPGTGDAAVTAADRAAAGTPGEVGVAVLDRGSGELSVGARGHTPYELASVVKLVTSADILHRGETGHGSVGAGTRTDITRALRLSDDDAMDELWETYGGQATVQDMIGLAGLHDASLPRDPGNWGETEMSAADVTAVYRYALTALDPTDTALVVDAMSSAADTAADGTDQAFGFLHAPRPAGVAAKQGWEYDGDVFAHSTGLLGPDHRYVAVVLTQQPQGPGEDAAFGHVTTDTAALTRALLPAGG